MKEKTEPIYYVHASCNGNKELAVEYGLYAGLELVDTVRVPVNLNNKK